MTMVTVAEQALKNSTASVLATLRRRPEATGSFLSIDSQHLLQQIKRPFKVPRTRQVPVVPMVLALGAAVLGTTATVLLVRRLVAARRPSEEGALTGEEMSANSPTAEELATSR